MTAKRSKEQPGIFLAEMSTAHFNFKAYGVTRRQALDALRLGIQRHCDATGAQLMQYVGKGNDEGDIIVLEMQPLVTYRDDSEI